MYYIYRIINNTNGKDYIGQRKCPENKTPESDKYMGSGVILKQSQQKNGIENFTKEIIACDLLTKKEVDEAEKLCILVARHFNKGEYNIADGGNGGDLGSVVNKKRGDSNKGRVSPWKGKHPSEEARKKMSESAKKRQRKPLSEETKKKISEANKGNKYGIGHKVSEASIIHITNLNKGNHLSDDVKRKISESIPWNKKNYTSTM